MLPEPKACSHPPMMACFACRVRKQLRELHVNSVLACWLRWKAIIIALCNSCSLLPGPESNATSSPCMTAPASLDLDPFKVLLLYPQVPNESDVLHKSLPCLLHSFRCVVAREVSRYGEPSNCKSCSMLEARLLTSVP